MNYIWGIGKKCEELIEDKKINLDLIDGFIQSKKDVDVFQNKKVYGIDEVKNYNCIIVAVKNNEPIYRICISEGIDLSKVCFIYPIYHFDANDKNIKLARNIFTEDGYKSICYNYGIGDTDWIEEDAKRYNKLNKHLSFQIEKNNNYYISKDKYQNAGAITSYFWQDLWAAKKIVNIRPTVHYDIGSRIDGFIAHLLTNNININLIDIRPMNKEIKGIDFTCSDATNLDSISDESIDSISALCSLEHFGLGRYGDPIDPDACFKCFSAIQRKVKSGGNIYIAVPVGKEHLEFNAHRVFYASTILENFDRCVLKEFSCAKNEDYEENIDIHKYDYDNSFGGTRFGLFWFVKK